MLTSNPRESKRTSARIKRKQARIWPSMYRNPAQDLKANICEVSNPTVEKNQGRSFDFECKMLKIFLATAWVENSTIENTLNIPKNYIFNFLL